jgi:hypothetical protein
MRNPFILKNGTSIAMNTNCMTIKRGSVTRSHYRLPGVQTFSYSTDVVFARQFITA